MNADSEEDVLSLLDGALKQCREYGGGDSSSVDSLSKYMACAFRVPLVDRALGMLGHGAPVVWACHKSRVSSACLQFCCL